MCTVDVLHGCTLCTLCMTDTNQPRDIKLENILLSGAAAQPILKLCDFGATQTSAADTHLHRRLCQKLQPPLNGQHGCRHPHLYVCCIHSRHACRMTDMAPEVLLQREYDGKLADVWSCGVVLYTMLAGRYPFTQPGESNLPALERQKLLLQRMVTEDASMPSDVILSSGCLDLLQRMLQRDPSRRIGSWQVLQHPWVRINLPEGVSRCARSFESSQPVESSTYSRNVFSPHGGIAAYGVIKGHLSTA